MLPATARLRRLCALLLLLAAGMARAADSPAPPPLASFFDTPAFSGALLSPSARYLAVRIGAEGRRESLAVINLETDAVTTVASFRDVDVGRFQWVNDERLAFDTSDKRIAPGDQDFGPGLYAVNRDGSKFRQLAERHGEDRVAETGTRLASRQLLPWHTYLLDQAGAQDSEFIYVQSPKFDGIADISYVDLLRLDTLTGRAQTVPRPASTQHWLLDQKGEPRLATAVDHDVESIYLRDPASSEWRKLASARAFGEDVLEFAPFGFGPDGTLYVTTRRGQDKQAMHTFDFARNAVNPTPLVKLADYDFTGTLVTGKGKLLGMHFQTDTAASMWFDPAMKALQASIDSLLPATVNTISVGAHAQAPWVLVTAFSDVQPMTYMLFNTGTKKFSKVGEERPAIRPAQMGHQQALRYKARDGLEIPAWLTLPRAGAAKNLPLVVLVHGGPYLRGGAWGWNADAQFLASRGYAVLEPEYRGSTGFGWAHYRAGWKQWGLRMQDDLADGARAMIAQGVADPKRICIAGASYGGYATLMGLINDPDLFKCGIDWVGVTDIKLMYTGQWTFESDMTTIWRDYGMPLLVGDQLKDAAQLKATSPLEQAARIKQPLLLAYGGVDRRVPAYHGKKFYDAVKATNRDVEWVVYADEGHGWSLPKNRIDFWGRVEKFLDRNIGKP